ncbi:MAG: tRNA nucleotidyltransferase [Flavobacteriaceae bacterium]|nr:MAG: tRNA nucleotidyltransferase [Flavobacteriaceae bacterium]
MTSNPLDSLFIEKTIKEALKDPLFEILSQTASQLGCSVYVVGGFVRDLLLGRPQKTDIDFVTESSGIELAKALAKALNVKKVSVFKTYGTAMLHYKGMDLEFVGARKESYSPDSRNPAVEKGTLQDDQNRRDFTINAMAISLNKGSFGELLAPFDALEDLQNKILVTPLDPGVTFSDDPLRMIRAIRFASQLDFTIDPDCLKAILANKNRMGIISRERIATEFNKIILSEKPSTGLLLLEQTGLLAGILPELCDLKGIKMAPAIFRRLKLPLGTHLKKVQKLIKLSSRPIALADEVTDSAVRRLIFDAGEDLDDLFVLCSADMTTKNQNKIKRYKKNFELVRQKMIEVEERDHIKNFQPPISGEQIMEILHLKPSKEVGILKNKIKEAVLEGIIPNEYSPAYDYLLVEAQKLKISI